LVDPSGIAYDLCGLVCRFFRRNPQSFGGARCAPRERPAACLSQGAACSTRCAAKSLIGMCLCSFRFCLIALGMARNSLTAAFTAHILLGVYIPYAIMLSFTLRFCTLYPACVGLCSMHLRPEGFPRRRPLGRSEAALTALGMARNSLTAAFTAHSLNIQWHCEGGG